MCVVLVGVVSVEGMGGGRAGSPGAVYLTSLIEILSQLLTESDPATELPALFGFSPNSLGNGQTAKGMAGGGEENDNRWSFSTNLVDLASTL